MSKHFLLLDMSDMSCVFSVVKALSTISSSPIEYAVVTSSGDAVYMANPTSEVKLDIEVISEQEKLIHSEFFDNRPGLKTPDRYLRIRTFIIDSW